MFAKRGISLNKNALNIQRAPPQPSLRTPSPPQLKSLVQPLKEQLQPKSENDIYPVQEKKLSKIPRLFESKIKPSPRVEEEIEDIDKNENRDAIFLVCDLAKDIYSYMYELEDKQSVQQDYLKDQKIFTPRHRQRLINWCIQVHHSLKLLPETLYMTISVIDRYFDQVIVKQQNQVQLVACGALLIAAKYEEIYPPELNDLVLLTQNSYSRRDIMCVEIQILETLNFDLGKPIPLAFLRRFSKAAHCDLKMHSIAKFIMEASLTEYECSHWNPSLLAAAALFVTLHLVERDWSKTMVHYTRYTRQQLREPASTLCKILKKVLKTPLSYAVGKKNAINLTKWVELKSPRVEALIV